MRLFVAVVPPPQAVAELDAAVAELRTDAPGLRWVRPEQWHRTVAFLGEVDDRACTELTLARGCLSPPELVPAADRLRDFTGNAWQARELHLVRSHFGAGQGGSARYDIAATWDLSGDAAR